MIALRARVANQPIVENYVGRQVPTAMVARNLDRGSGFLRPQLDTGPFPSLFLVEPPLYASAAVLLRRASGLGLGASGRLVSALGTALAAWGLFGLARRREGTAAALAAVAAFALLPVTIRYGRAFQPDALMLGLLLAGLRGWDEHEAGGSRWWLALGWVGLALGLALKITSAFVLVPLVAAIIGRPLRPKPVALALSTLLPALLWYVHAEGLLAEGTGSRASADNRAIWMQTVLAPARLDWQEWRMVAWALAVRVFTPLGFVLAVAGWSSLRSRLWSAWGLSMAGALAILAGKLHHEYYWLAAAPLASVSIGRAVAGLAARGSAGRVAAGALAAALAALAVVQTASTWRTPPEWLQLDLASETIRRLTPADALVVAPEALLWAADRRGCRLEVEPRSAARAAGEWGKCIEDDDPMALVELYRARGARVFADVWDVPSPRRRALHDAIRSRFEVLDDRPGLLVARLDAPGGDGDGDR